MIFTGFHEGMIMTTLPVMHLPHANLQGDRFFAAVGTVLSKSAGA